MAIKEGWLPQTRKRVNKVYLVHPQQWIQGAKFFAGR